jgi:hypothetical protein
MSSCQVTFYQTPPIKDCWIFESLNEILMYERQTFGKIMTY